jgi:hypothetical protein
MIVIRIYCFLLSSSQHQWFGYWLHVQWRGRRGRDRMVVGFTTTYAISDYHHWCCEFESRSERVVQHYVIKFVISDFLTTSRWVSSSPPISSTNKTDRHDIAEILLKVALNTIKQTNKHVQCILYCLWFVWYSSLYWFSFWFLQVFVIMLTLYCT